jgi:Ca2+-binding RTX toxin-like protein
MATFVGTSGNDTITPALISAGVVRSPLGSNLSGNDRIVANAGNDRVEPDSGNDVALLGPGHDRFIWNPGDGDDRVDGGTGTDRLEFNGSAGIERMTVTTLSNGGFRVFRDLGDITVDARNVERITMNAGDGNDVVDATEQTRSTVRLDVRGDGGNDVLTGGAGSDRIVGGTGNDVAFGLSGNDVFVWNPGDGDDTFGGGVGVDSLDFNGSDGAEIMTVTTFGDRGFRFFRNLGDITVDASSTERVLVDGLGGDDFIDAAAQTVRGVALSVRAGDGNDTAIGGAGNDSIEGNAGNDLAFGGRGHDTFEWNPGDGNDVFNGQSGRDTLVFNGSAQAERMSIATLNTGGFHFARDLGSITVDTTSVERVVVNLGSGNDRFSAGNQTNANISLDIQGGGGADRISGGAGRDVIRGGSGDDRTAGGGGADTWVIGAETRNGAAETDVILGYSEAAGDVVNLRAAGGFLSSSVINGNLVLALNGGDQLIFRGVTNLADVTLIL